ncbi:unnamed protein product [Heterobilharzia americana]|nr:unnamed protein product [Heterobilharzia americana]
MDYSQLSNKSVKLSELLDLALGTPDPGSVNFGILYIILSYIIKHLRLSDVEPDIDRSTPGPQSHSDLKISISDLTPNLFHSIQKRLSDVEVKLQLLNSLPNNQDIIGSIFNDSENNSNNTNTINRNINEDKRDNSGISSLNDSIIDRKVANLWQSVQTSKRLDATEEGLHRKTFRTNKTLKAALDEALINSSLKDQLAELTRKLGEIEKRQNQEANLLQNVVHMDALRGLVFWHTLGKSITGIDYLTAYSQCLPDEFLECPDPDLSSTLRKLGNVASGFDSVVNRIEQLEISVQHDADPGKTLMKEKADRSELDGLGVPSELYEKIYSLEAIISELAKEREKIYVDCGTSPHMPYPSDNKKLLKKLQDTMSVLQEQINQLNNTLSNVQSQFKKVCETVEDVKQYADDLETRKADASYVDVQLDKKANCDDVKNLIDRSEFQSTNQTLQKLIEDLFAKLTAAEEEYKELLSNLQEAMDNKLDRDEIEQLRDWLEKRFKTLNKRLSSLTTDNLLPTGPIIDDAAGLRRSLMQHYHCISCDRPLEVAVSQEYLSTYSTDNRGFPMNKSIRPYTTYDLESLRHQIQTSNGHYYDIYGTPRQCGGTHTAASSSKRKSRATTCKSSFVETDGHTTKSSIHYSCREIRDLQGMDGHIYRGSPIQESQHLINIDSPTIIKDDEYTDKDVDKGDKLPPVTKTTRYVNTITNKPQSTYKYIGSDRREKSQSPQRLKRVNSEEFQMRQSSPIRIEHLPKLIVGSTQLPNQRVRKIQPVQPSSKFISDHVAVKTNGYAVIVVPNTGTVEEEISDDVKVNISKNGWTIEKSNNECDINLSPTYLNDEENSRTNPSPAIYENDEVDTIDGVIT